MATLTGPSVEAAVQKITSYVSRPLGEFQAYKALELLEGVKNAAQDSNHERRNYYKVA